MSYYEEVAGAKLAGEFYAEIQSQFGAVASAPETHRKYAGELRRVDLTRFPYHFLSLGPRPGVSKQCRFFELSRSQSK